MSKQKRMRDEKRIQRQQSPKLELKNIKNHAQTKSQKPASPRVLWSAPPYIKPLTCINRYQLSPIFPIIVPVVACPVPIAIASPAITYPHQVPISCSSFHKYSQEKQNKGCFCNNVNSDRLSQPQELNKNFNFKISINTPIEGQKCQTTNSQQKQQFELINQYKALCSYTQAMKSQNQQLKAQNSQLKQLKERIQDIHKDRLKNIREAIDKRKKEIEKQLFDLKKQNKQCKEIKQNLDHKQIRVAEFNQQKNKNIKIQKNRPQNKKKIDTYQDNRGIQFRGIQSHENQMFYNNNNNLKRCRSHQPNKFYIINCCENCTEKVLEKIPQQPRVLYSFKDLGPNFHILNNHTFGRKAENQQFKDQIQTQQTQFYRKCNNNKIITSKCEQCNYNYGRQKLVQHKQRNYSRLLNSYQQQRNWDQEYIESNLNTPNDWRVKECQASLHSCNNMKTTVKYKTFGTPTTNSSNEDQCLLCLQQKYNTKFAKLQCNQFTQYPTYLQVEGRNKKDVSYGSGLILDNGYRTHERVVRQNRVIHNFPSENFKQQNINQVINKLKYQNSILRNIKTTYI